MKRFICLTILVFIIFGCTSKETRINNSKNQKVTKVNEKPIIESVKDIKKIGIINPNSFNSFNDNLFLSKYKIISLNSIGKKLESSYKMNTPDFGHPYKIMFLIHISLINGDGMIVYYLEGYSEKDQFLRIVKSNGEENKYSIPTGLKNLVQQEIRSNNYNQDVLVYSKRIYRPNSYTDTINLNDIKLIGKISGRKLYVNKNDTRHETIYELKYKKSWGIAR